MEPTGTPEAITETHVFRIVDVGPHKAITIRLQPGINCFTGKNGAGKTSALNAIVRASGGDAPVSVRRIGYDENGEPITAGYGTVEGPTMTGSGILIRVGGTVGRRETPVATLANYGTLHRIVDGDNKSDPKVRDSIRIEAILTARPIPLDSELLNVLTGGHQILAPNAAAALIKRQTSILDVAEQLKAAINDRALAAEKEAAQLKGAAEAARARLATLPQPEDLLSNLAPYLDGDLEAIREMGEELRSASDKAQAEATRRTELEDIKAALGARPDPSKLNSQLADIQAQAEENTRRTNTAAKELEELERFVAAKKLEISELKSAARTLQGARETLQARQRQLELEASRYDSNIEKFSTIETLATPEQAAQKLEAYNDARRRYAFTAQAQKAEETRRARLEARNTTEEEARRAEDARQTKANEAQAWRSFAKGTSSRVGQAMALKGIPNLTIGDDGRLYYVETDEAGNERTRAPFEERSYGQKIDTMLEIGSAGGDIFPLDPNFFFQLQPQKRLELAQKAQARGFSIITEWPTDDPEIGILHLTGASDAEILQSPPIANGLMLTNSDPLTDAGPIDTSAAPASPEKKGKKGGLELSLFTPPAPSSKAPETTAPPTPRRSLAIKPKA